FFGQSDLAWAFLTLQDRIVTKAPSSRYNQVLTYESDGAPQGLPYYMTAPVTWLFLDALSGVVPDLDRQRLRIGSDWLFRSEGARVPVVLSSSWFMLECRREEREIRLDFIPVKTVRPFRVQELVVMCPDAASVRTVSVDGIEVAPRKEKGGRFVVPTDFDPGKKRLRLEFCF
ncbi:MAG: hypothetical protein KAI38_02985, partial [Candidatus Latescibacteria bacterium]|nr:hypothetical protein [Candidatus Latescibacterota bacterium]